MVRDVHIRPFVWGHLLWTCAVRVEELLQSVTHLCQTDDLKTFHDDMPRLEAVVRSVLAEFQEEGLVRCRPDGLYVLNIPTALSKATSVACATNAQLPAHALNDLARFHLPNYERQQPNAGQPAALASF